MIFEYGKWYPVGDAGEWIPNSCEIVVKTERGINYTSYYKDGHFYYEVPSGRIFDSDMFLILPDYRCVNWGTPA